MAPRSVSAAACVLLVALCAGCLGAVGAAVPATEALGLVSRDGSHFVLDGAPFYVTGANQVCTASARRLPQTVGLSCACGGNSRKPASSLSRHAAPAIAVQLDDLR